MTFETENRAVRWYVSHDSGWDQRPFLVILMVLMALLSQLPILREQDRKDSWGVSAVRVIPTLSRRGRITQSTDPFASDHEAEMAICCSLALFPPAPLSLLPPFRQDTSRPHSIRILLPNPAHPCFLLSVRRSCFAHHAHAANANSADRSLCPKNLGLF